MALERRDASIWARAWADITLLGTAETVLANAALVREANVLSNLLEAHVEFQSAIQRPFPCNVASSVHGGVAGESHSDPYFGMVPKTLVRVVHRKARRILYWDTEKLTEQVGALHKLWSGKLGPSVAHHTDIYTQLFGNDLTRFSHIGTVRLPLFPLAQQTQRMWRMPVQSLDFSILAYCRVGIAYVCPYEDGVICRVTLDELTGLTVDDVSELHLQLRLDSLAGAYDPNAETYATRPILLEVQPCSDVRMQATLRVPCSDRSHAHWQFGSAAIHVFAYPTTAFLDRMAARDEQKESQFRLPSKDLVSILGITPPSSQARIHERKRRLRSVHGVRAEVHMLSLNRNGVPLVVKQSSARTPYFLIDDTSIKCLAVALDSDSNAELPWQGIRRIQVGDVQLYDGLGTVIRSEPDYCTLQRCVQSQNAEVLALWRPTQELLQQATPPRHSLRLVLHVEVEIKDSQPLILSIPLHFRIQEATAPRQQVPNVEDVFWDKVQRLPRDAHHAFFSLSLSPGRIVSAKDLWRVDTRTVQVPGDTGTTPLPRGLTLVADYMAAWRRDMHAVNVCRTRERLLHLNLPPASCTNLHPLVAFWQKRTSAYAMLRAHWTCVLENAGTFTYTAESQLVTLDRCLVEGWLDIQRDALSNSWLHAWFELRPPFLIARIKPGGCDVILNVYLCGVHVYPAMVDDPQKHVLGLYTNNTACLLSAPSAASAMQWRTALSLPLDDP